MKNRFFVTLLTMLFCVTVFSQPSPSLINQLKKARGYMDREKYDKAIILCEDILKKWSIYDESYPFICKMAGACAYQLEDYAKAIKWYTEAMKYGKFDQNDSDDNVGLLASSYANSGDHKSAEKVFLNAIKNNINISNLLRECIMMYVDVPYKDKDYQVFINILLELIKKTSDPSELNKIFSRLGDFYSALGMFHEAKDNYEKAVAILPSFSPFFKLGSIYYNLAGLYELAKQTACNILCNKT